MQKYVLSAKAAFSFWKHLFIFEVRKIIKMKLYITFINSEWIEVAKKLIFYRKSVWEESWSI